MISRLALLALVAIAASGCFSPRSVGSGERGVMWTITSGTSDKIYEEGWVLVAWWNRFYVYSVRTHDVKENLSAITRDRLQLPVEVSVRFRVRPDAVAKLHTTYGPKFYDAAIGSPLRSAVRSVIGNNNLEEVYSTRRSMVEDEIYAELVSAVEPGIFMLDEIFVRDISLPDKIKEAIDKKLAAEQEAQAMDFRLDKERKEAERKEIEARGIQKFQQIVKEGIDDRLLRWKGIEATETLAQSPNAKVIVIGGGKDGLPLILGNP